MQSDILEKSPTTGMHNESFVELLEKYGFQARTEGLYLEVGEIRPGNWILDISVIVTELRTLLKKVLPFLAQINIPFRIPVDMISAAQLYTADFGYEQLGRVICVYPHTDKEAITVAKALISYTEHVRGAAIPSATHLGGSVYARLSTRPMVPFILPKSSSWPFHWKKRPRSKPSQKRLLAGRYMVTEYLKRDVKGDVLKAIDIKYWWKIQFKCVIGKEGKRFMSLDQSGRTIKDRLRWQLKLQKDLFPNIAVPEVFDFFEDKTTGDVYLWMENITGNDLHTERGTIAGGRTWWSLEPEKQRKILSYLLKVLEIIENLHAAGYVHRDITPVNFLVETTGRLRLIDLELTYSSALFGTNPPFTYGTPGFMSPEQSTVASPTSKEDIYGVGGLMIALIAGFHPCRLTADPQMPFSEKLNFFVNDRQVSELISACLSDNPTLRPPLSQVKSAILSFDAKVGKIITPPLSIPIPCEAEGKRILQEHILSYKSGSLADLNGLWYSGEAVQNKYVANPGLERHSLPGWSNGIAGIQYVLSLLQINGFDLSPIHPELAAGWSCLQQNYLVQPNSLPPGLYEGSYGMAISLSVGMEANLVVNSRETQSYLHQLLNQPPQDLSLARGVAGLGVALLTCRQWLPSDLSKTLLENCVSTIVHAQQKEGSWLFPKEGAPNAQRKYTGLSYGVAGVIFFLLEYGNAYNNPRAIESATRGLDWLISIAHRNSQTMRWPYHPKSSQTDYWLHLGNGGIVFAFLNAFEYTGNERFLKAAESCLESYPAYIQSENVGYINGLSGIGKLYLNAHRLTNNPEWKKRGNHILQSILHCYCKNDKTQGISWNTTHSSFRSGEYLFGNAGIAYYLLQAFGLDKNSKSFIL